MAREINKYPGTIKPSAGIAFLAWDFVEQVTRSNSHYQLGKLSGLAWL
jgi:hypothetical protein